jgi:hypothetical protein
MAYPETTWSSGTTYAINNLVNYRGMDYISLANGNLANIPPATVGTSWNPYTSWLVGTTYSIGNTVDYQGWGYTSLVNSNLSNTPVPGGTDLKWAKTSGDYQLRAGVTYLVLPWESSGVFGRLRALLQSSPSVRTLVKPWESSGIYGRGIGGRLSPTRYMRVTSAANFLPFSGLHANTIVDGPFFQAPMKRLGLTAGQLKWGYSVPSVVVGPDGLIILIGAPFTAKLGVPT